MMRRAPKLNLNLAIAGFLIALVAFFAIFAYLDWIIGTWVNNPYVDSPERTAFNTVYWTWLGVAMIMIGVFGAAVAKLSVADKKLGVLWWCHNNSVNNI